MDFEIDANLLKSMMGGDEATSENSGNPQRAAKVKRDKAEIEQLKKENELKKGRLTLEEKIYKSMLKEEKYRQTIVQGIFSANNKLLGQEMLASVKKQNAQGKEVSTLDILKKKYAWQLLYFTAVAAALGLMLSNSKLLSAFTDMIGSGLGFILDMLLTAVIPYVIQFMDWLFKIGQYFSGLPDNIKLVVLALGTLFGTAGALLFYGVLKGIAEKIIAIGTEAVLSKASVDKLTAAREAAVTAPLAASATTTGALAAGEVGSTVGLGLSAGILTGAAAFYYKCLTDPEGVKSAVNSVIQSLYSIGSFGGTLTDEQKARGKAATDFMFTGLDNNNSNTTINISIDGEAIDRTLWKESKTHVVG